MGVDGAVHISKCGIVPITHWLLCILTTLKSEHESGVSIIFHGD